MGSSNETRGGKNRDGWSFRHSISETVDVARFVLKDY